MLNNNHCDENIKMSMGDWIVAAQRRIDQVDHNKMKTGHTRPRLHKNRHGHDVMFVNTSGGRHTNICVVCFTMSGHVKVACGSNVGLPGLSCCSLHRDGQKQKSKQKPIQQRQQKQQQQQQVACERVSFQAKAFNETDNGDKKDKEELTSSDEDGAKQQP